MAVDLVNSPAHYTQGAIECIDALESLGIAKDFCRGNAIKYLWRLGHKDNALQDARKAQWYLNRLITILEKESSSGNPANQ
jgi:hypothetical protein